MRRILVIWLIGLASVTFQIQVHAQAQPEEDKRAELVTIDLGTDHFAAGISRWPNRWQEICWLRAERSLSRARSEAMRPAAVGDTL